MRFRSVLIGLGLALAAIAVVVVYGRPLWHPLYLRLAGRATVASQVARIDAGRRAEIEGLFGTWPPDRLVIIAYKRERELELWEPGRRAAVLPILAASGGPGPKLREGDRQVPEGIYELEALNPNSAYHLALRVGYPNAFDRAQAARDGRDRLGGDIMIHGKAASIGCLALGDPGIEVVFKAAAAAGRTRILIAPQRGGPPALPADAPPWLAGMYAVLYQAIATATAGPGRDRQVVRAVLDRYVPDCRVRYLHADRPLPAGNGEWIAVRQRPARLAEGEAFIDLMLPADGHGTGEVCVWRGDAVAGLAGGFACGSDEAGNVLICPIEEGHAARPAASAR